MNVGYGERLKSERKRLGLSQAEFGKQCGVGITAQVNYEKERRQPGANYLIKTGDLGGDVNFILTGIKSGSGIIQADSVVKSANKEGLDTAELVEMFSLIGEQMQDSGLDFKDHAVIEKMLGMYLDLSHAQTYHTRDEAGQKQIKLALRRLAQSIA